MSGGQPMSLTIRNHTENLAKVRGFVAQGLRDAPITPEERNKVVLAVDEAVANVIEHGYNADANGAIEVSLDVQTGLLRVVVRDWGQAFDPSQVADPDLEEHVRMGKKGGLGIYLIRQIMDEVFYAATPDKGNELVLIKHFP